MDSDFAILSSHAGGDAQQRAVANVEALLERNQRSILQQFPGLAAEPKFAQVGIVGGGVMGASIAAATIKHGVPVVAADTNSDALARFPAMVERLVREDPEAARSEHSLGLANRITTAESTQALADCDLVIEAVTERLDVKKQVYRELEGQLADHAILTSNTSTLPIGRLSESMKSPDRFCGTHFFLPVSQRPLVEIVRGPRSGNPAVGRAVAFANLIQKIPLVVNDATGFVVNRLLMAYVSEGMQLLLEGVSREQIDAAAVEFGMAFGPLALLDIIGVDVALNCGWVFAGAYPDIMLRCPLLVALKKAGRLGRKSGAGFYRYDQEQHDGRVTACADPAFDEFVTRWRGATQQHTPDSIVARLFLPPILEGTRILQDQTVAKPQFVDLAAIHGLGFPRQRGGLFFWADAVGAEYIVAASQSLKYLGKRFEPTPLLSEVVRRKQRFYDLHA